MASAAPLPPPLRASAAVAIAKQFLSAKEINTMRIMHVVTRIHRVFQSGSRADPAEFVHLCFSLARGIDYAVAYNDTPSQACDLPSLIKQVYHRRNEDAFKTAIMVLMISIKNACKSGWFQAEDTNELLIMANELSSNFSTAGSVTSKESNALDIISLILPRFYPRIKLDHLIISFEVKPGYEILAVDFNVQKSVPPGDKIRLLVAQTDDMETSSCIVTPPQVNFLVNGKGVDKRTNVSVDCGPQFPTDITKFLKYGTNLIQAIGYFSGNYIIAIASMSTITSSDVPILQDYVQPVLADVASDSEIIEGPSRISLNCPISFRHIRTPVKGRLCKHHQCFDYDNFMEMNSRKPSWRCPHCNQPVSCVDIRVDQNMVKILREAGEDVADVIISADGSWKVATKNNVQLYNQTPTLQQDGNAESDFDNFSSTIADVVDLTMGEDGGSDAAIVSAQMDTLTGFQNWNNGSIPCEDRKPFQNVQGFSVSDLISEPRLVNETPEISPNRRLENELWSMISLSAAALNQSVAHTATANACTVGSSQPFAPTDVLFPVITDAISPVLNRDRINDVGAPQPVSTLQTTQVRQITNNLQLQQSRFGSSIINTEPERPPIPRHVSRVPIAVQALPVQTQGMFPQRPRISGQILSSMTSNAATSISPHSSSPIAAVPGGLNAVNGDLYSMIQVLGLPAPSQVGGVRTTSDQLRGEVLGLPASSQAGGVRTASDQLRGVFANSPFLQPHMEFQASPNEHANFRPHQTVGQSTGILPLPPQSSRIPPSPSVQIQQAWLRSRVAAQHQEPRTASSVSMTADILRHSAGEHSQSSSTGARGGLSDLPSEQNWQPTGRMRGSLTGTAYSAAINQYMAQPTQSLTSRPPASSSTGVNGIGSQPHNR